jgi:hypothetical protein
MGNGQSLDGVDTASLENRAELALTASSAMARIPRYARPRRSLHSEPLQV